MPQDYQIAIITGGASGIGLAVAEALTARAGWMIYLLDRDVSKGQAAARILGANFLEVDVADYNSLAACFKHVFEAHNKLSFVFANAGIAVDPKAQTSGETEDGTPEAPSLDIIAVNLYSVIFTTQLAQHYFRQCPEEIGPRSIVVTASSASLYASQISPMYCASKHGVLGWVRSVGPVAWKQDRVAINAICPGIVKTNIVPEEMYTLFPDEMLTPLTKVVEVVLMLCDGTLTEAEPNAGLSGQAVEICGNNHYVRKQIDFCDATMAEVMGATEVGGRS